MIGGKNNPKKKNKFLYVCINIYIYIYIYIKVIILSISSFYFKWNKEKSDKITFKWDQLKKKVQSASIFFFSVPRKNGCLVWIHQLHIIW